MTIIPSYKTPATILLIHDEAIVRTILINILEHEGYQVITATNVETALQTFAKSDISLILIDISKPIVNSNNLIKTLRETFRCNVIFFGAKDKTHKKQLKKEPDIIENILELVKSEFSSKLS